LHDERQNNAVARVLYNVWLITARRESILEAISVQSVGKRYQRHTSTFRRFCALISERAAAQTSKHWALQDISFSLRPGESVGIIGQNGAGKSTLLKIITGTTAPTTGTVSISGRVAALLELGMGFHPEFTGRSNLVIAGQLLGLSVEDISRRMPEIEAFAQIGEYINEPVRTYSSGMQVRLAFALATAVRPDVLIVDEALSVGDIFFQQKCYERIKEFRDQGTTLLFVSHDLGAIHNLCDRALLLEGGRMKHDGSPKEAIDLYQASLLKASDKNPDAIKVEIASSANSNESDIGSITTELASVLSVSIIDQAEQPLESFLSEEEIAVRVVVRFNQTFSDPHVGYKIRDRLGRVIFETNTYCMNRSIGKVTAGQIITVDFAFRAALHAGEYTTTIGVADSGYLHGSFKQQLAYVHELAPFTVLLNHNAIRWSGLYNVAPTLRVQRN
jgi:lipopolysaccharide transport system ATP-binding protein